MRLIFSLSAVFMVSVFISVLSSCVATPIQPDSAQDSQFLTDQIGEDFIGDVVDDDAQPALTSSMISTLESAVMSAQKSPAELFQEAEEATLNFPQRAITLYLDGLIQQPENLAAHKALAELYLRQGFYIEAASHYETIWREQPSAEIAVVLTDAFLEAGMPLPASMVAEVGIEAFPAEHRLYSGAIRAFEQLGMIEKTLFWLDRLSRIQAVDAQNWIRVAELAEASSEWLVAAKVWSSLLNDTHHQQALAAMQRMEAHALRIGNGLFFAPTGWQLQPGGFLEYDSGRFVELVSNSVNEIDAEAVVQDMLLNGLPFFTLNELEDLLPDRWEVNVLGGEKSHSTEIFSEAERRELMSSVPPAPLRLKRLMTDDPSGSLTLLSIVEPGFMIPVGPQERHLWLGQLSGRWVVVSETSPLGFGSDSLVIFLRELMENAILTQADRNTLGELP